MASHGPGTIGSGSGDQTIQGDLVIKDPQGKVRIRLDSQTGNIFLNNAQGQLIFLWCVSAISGTTRAWLGSLPAQATRGRALSSGGVAAPETARERRSPWPAECTAK